MIATPEGWDLDSRGERRREARWDDLTTHEIRLGSAFHEAGHAMMVLRYGFELIEVTSGPVPPPSGVGVAFTGNTRWAANRPPWREQAILCAAGSRAHALYLRDTNVWRPEYAETVAAPHDRQDAIDAAAVCGAFLTVHGLVPNGVDGARWSEIEAEADKELRAVWSKVCVVATELYTAERLTGARVRQITGMPGTGVRA